MGGVAEEDWPVTNNIIEPVHLFSNYTNCVVLLPRVLWHYLHASQVYVLSHYRVSRVELISARGGKIKNLVQKNVVCIQE